MNAACTAVLIGCLMAGCGAEGDLAPCNIATKSCQEDVFYADMRLRGAAFDPFDGVPPIRTITLAQYQSELLAKRPKAKATVKATGKPKIKPWDEALRLLGLIKPSTSVASASIEDAVSNVAAFYSGATRSVTVIDRGGDRNDYADTKLLAHELVHAFQDDELGDFGVLTTDSSFAARALTEGEATLYEELAGAEMDGVVPQDVDWGAHYGRWVKGLRSSLPKQKSTFYAVNWFVYPLGAGMLTRAWLDGGPAGVRNVMAAFPARTLDFVANHEAFTPPSSPKLRCRVVAPGEGFKGVGADSFGALQFYAFLAAARLPEADAWAHAEKWRDDTLWVYFDDAAQAVVVYWRVRLSSKAQATAVVDAIPTSTDRTLEAIGQDVLVRGSNVPGHVDVGQDDVVCDP